MYLLYCIFQSPGQRWVISGVKQVNTGMKRARATWREFERDKNNKNQAKRGRVKDGRGQKINKWGEVDWRSNPCEVQTAPRGAMALRRRDQARRTSQDSVPTEHLACQALPHLSSSLTGLKTFTNTPPGPAQGYNTPLSSRPLPIFAVFLPISLSREAEKTKCDKQIWRAGDGMLSCHHGHKPPLPLCRGDPWHRDQSRDKLTACIKREGHVSAAVPRLASRRGMTRRHLAVSLHCPFICSHNISTLSSLATQPIHVGDWQKPRVCTNAYQLPRLTWISVTNLITSYQKYTNNFKVETNNSYERHFINCSTSRAI